MRNHDNRRATELSVPRRNGETITIKEDIRVMNTPDLLRLRKQAEELGFNRYPAAVDINAMRLDPNGFHVCRLVLANHEGHTNKDIVHHRISVFAKKWQPSSEALEPVEFMLDMRAEEWEALQAVESFHQALVTINNRVPGAAKERLKLFT
jgi:hypothetical protein